MRISKSYFATTQGAAGCSICASTDTSEMSRRYPLDMDDAHSSRRKDWQNHPKSAAKPDFSSWDTTRR